MSSQGIRVVAAALALGGLCVPSDTRADGPSLEARRPANDGELKFWLDNMFVHHGYSLPEASLATGMTADELETACRRLGVERSAKPGPERPGGPLKVLPYPGGRHPRVGFLEGAVNPQRETKVSVFAPWDPSSYVVVDVPETINSNQGRLYLAHFHQTAPTIWDKKGVTRPRQEWERNADGSLESTRQLPNGVRFQTQIKPDARGVRMGLTLTNGTDATLTNLGVQVCVMFKQMAGFSEQSTEFNRMEKPYIARCTPDRKRWVITAWTHGDRLWGQPLCPCIHSDPKFPDCPPGESRELRGWLSFYEGDDIELELKRIEATGWRKPVGK